MVLNLSAKWLMAVLSASMGIGLRETRTKIRTVGLCLKTSHTERNTMEMDMHLERLGSWILIMHPSEYHPWNRFSTKLFDRNLFINNRTLCHFWQKKNWWKSAFLKTCSIVHGTCWGLFQCCTFSVQ